MSDQPDPLVPTEVDLRDFAFMPLEFRRLFGSETWVLGAHDARCAALCLWCESWHQTPAASLPDNEKMLAHLSQSGSRWGKLRDHVMRGWVLCSDGRWYHPVVAEKALDAWAKHKKASSKGKAGASKRWGTGISSGNGTGIDQLMPADSNREGHGNREGDIPRKRGSPRTPLPDGFAVSERVAAWAEARGIENLPAHFDYFVGQARAKGYKYSDWDQALMNAVRDDWAKIGDGRRRVAH